MKTHVFKFSFIFLFLQSCFPSIEEYEEREKAIGDYEQSEKNAFSKLDKYKKREKIKEVINSIKLQINKENLYQNDFSKTDTSLINNLEKKLTIQIPEVLKNDSWKNKVTNLEWDLMYKTDQPMLDNPNGIFEIKNTRLFNKDFFAFTAAFENRNNLLIVNGFFDVLKNEIYLHKFKAFEFLETLKKYPGIEHKQCVELTYFENIQIEVNETFSYDYYLVVCTKKLWEKHKLMETIEIDGKVLKKYQLMINSKGKVLGVKESL